MPQLLIPRHAGRLEGRLPLISHDRSNGETLVRSSLRFLGGRLFCLPLDVSAPADLLFPLCLDMPVRFTDRLRHIFHIMLLTKLMRH
jgi:hypothetical protein